MTTNAWCERMELTPPKLAALVRHREANNYSLLIVALLERGQPMTLIEVAQRFEEVGIADRDDALLSLKRCKPARAPIFRVDDHYHLDTQHKELRYWISRFDLRPRPAVVPSPVVRAPMPSPDVALTLAELDEAWTKASVRSWSAKILVIAVLDAHGGGPMAPDEVVAVVAKRTQWHTLSAVAPHFGRAGSGITVGPDGRWAVALDATEALMRARGDVRAMREVAQKWAAQHGTPSDQAAQREVNDVKTAQRKAAHAKLSRAVLAAFPPLAPEVVSLVDVGRHTVTTFFVEAFESLVEQLKAYDIIVADGIRHLLRALDFDQGDRSLVDLGTTQKTTRINQRGDKLQITTALIIRGTCGIKDPCGDPAKMTTYLANGDRGKLQRRLESDVKALVALYDYGRFHNYLRLRWGFVDDVIDAPWASFDEVTIHNLVTSAGELGVPLECVVGSSAGWADPWARARLFMVEKSRSGHGWCVIDEIGAEVDARDIQLARVVGTRH